ncbi:MAG: ParB/RepB/Spo0J family partition protein [Phycisphaerae bacterium]|nr:ParB/RepB/Spo0J family partition protein [Phycisphaerae bacterium]
MAPPKSRLGRGLDSLVSSDAPTPAPAVSLHPAAEAHTRPGTVQFIRLDQIKPNPLQPRSAIDPASLVGLVDSLRTSGLLQPILVRRHNDAFQIIAGERRWRAAKQAGLSSIPAIVREASEGDMLEIALIENLQRTDLTPLDRAAAYAAYMSGLSLTQDQASHRLGQDRATIANYVRLLGLHKDVREFLIQGKISMGHARALLALSEPADQRKLARLIAEKNLSVRRTEDLVRQARQTSSPIPARVEDLAKQANLRELEDRLSRRLGRRVRIRSRGSGEKGEIIINFGSLDEFDELVAKLCAS